jgi:hypothetical protein
MRRGLSEGQKQEAVAFTSPPRNSFAPNFLSPPPPISPFRMRACLDQMWTRSCWSTGPLALSTPLFPPHPSNTPAPPPTTLHTPSRQDAGVSRSDVDEVVLVGGSTRIPKVRKGNTGGGQRE